MAPWGLLCDTAQVQYSQQLSSLISTYLASVGSAIRCACAHAHARAHASSCAGQQASNSSSGFARLASGRRGEARATANPRWWWQNTPVRAPFLCLGATPSELATGRSSQPGPSLVAASTPAPSCRQRLLASRSE
ncbi:hypothetical protein CC80DRAFT_499367 [Byssothecium circinans]|uniref:Uncharacterized protein n=1 Tax=Byssothecium circinans TaxID=147558 RepID=A0A6A5UPT2_9PLEO|nr:hypothetical protein CC80DRAFT_499367 [Byssothecium circinans]